MLARNIHFSFMPSSPWDIEITKYITYNAFYITINKTIISRITAWFNNFLLPLTKFFNWELSEPYQKEEFHLII